jgi:ABC-type sugar transport system ATPase subunit
MTKGRAATRVGAKDSAVGSSDREESVDTPRVTLRVEGLSKTFLGTKALSDVDLDIRAGEVHAVVGHNGSGKSTLIKVLSGYHQPDPGGLAWLDCDPVALSELARGKHGQTGRLSFVHQDLGLVLELNTIENLALHGGFARNRWGRVRWKEQACLARELMAPFAVDLDVTRPLSKATPVERTIVAIAAALQGRGTRDDVLVLDEPTAVLPPGEVERLFSIVRQLCASGAGVLYVSHRLDEIFSLADRVTVLRGGRRVATREVVGLKKAELVHLMLGVEMEPDYRAALPMQDSARPMLEVKGLAGTYVRDVSLTLRQGEVLGVAGLPDSGRDELPRLLTDRTADATAGSIRVGPESSWTDIGDWKARSVALLPPDRASEGVIGPMTVEENLALSVLGQFGSPLLLNRRRQRQFAARWMHDMGVVSGGADMPVQMLSGGNQQKVLFGRTLARRPKVLVLCEPTAGVDIGARHAIYELVAEQVRQGLSVIVTSSDVQDLLALCTRVLILHRGVVAGELKSEGLTEHQLVHAMEGMERQAS